MREIFEINFLPPPLPSPLGSLMDYDFRPSTRIMARRPRRKKYRIYLLPLLLAAIGIPLFFILRPAIFSTEARLSSGEVAIQAARPDPRDRVIEGAIRPGETMNNLLGEFFSPRELHDLGRESREVFPLSEICAGQPYKLRLSDGDFERLEYDIDDDDQLIIRRTDEGFDVDRVAIDYRVETQLVQGVIRSSLFATVDDIGERAELAMTLADIFAWDVNFIRDIHAGDGFKALVEKRFRQGQPAGYGRILAAEFTNQGETFRAFLFRDGDQPAAYYDAKGNNLRKAFLKAPLAFNRISSGFSMRRFHPISKTWKAHPAIDYAAPTGTPIRAIGDATVARVDRTRYNGNFIKLRHAGNYESLYLHMSRFARGMKQGKKIAQGTIIGYVGSTGLATGPHLCFRMFRRGSPINPAKIKTLPASAVSRTNRTAFEAALSPMLAQLTGHDTRQARNEQAEKPIPIP